MLRSEWAQERLWLVGLIILVIAASFLAVQVNSTDIALTFLLLLLGLVAVGLLTGIWGGFLAGVAGVSAILLANLYAGLYPRETFLINTATQAVMFLAAGVVAGRLSIVLDRAQSRTDHWRSQAEQYRIHDEQLGVLKPDWALERLEAEVQRALRFSRPLTVWMLHLTPQPNANEAAGERLAVLQATLRVLRALAHPPAVFSYLGEDRILVILPEFDAVQTQSLANNFRDRCKLEHYFPPGQNYSLGRTIAEWGVFHEAISSLSGAGDSAAGVLERARSALK